MSPEQNDADARIENKTVRAALKVALVLFATALSTLFFGMFVPFFLLAMRILPSLGVGGVVYLGAGGIFGLLLGAVTTGVSLGRSERLVTRTYVRFVVGLALLSVAYLACWGSMQDRFSHV